MISIIIPAYNRAKIIHKTFDSILDQTYRELEVVVVNDGSKDETEQVAEQYIKKFKEANIVFKFFNQTNQGAPSARNHGFRKSVGEYLMFCDADAELKPNALELLLQTLTNHPEASYAYASFLWGKKLFKVGAFDANRLKQGPFIHTMALIRREQLPAAGWDETIKKFQDWDMWLTMLEENHTGIWIDQVLYTIEPGGTISNWLPSFAYKLLPWLPQVKKYNNAMVVIKAKHKL